MTLIEIIKKFKFPILLVIGFVLIENLAWIIEPNFFGKLLDALIDKFSDHEKVDYMTPLIVWVGIYLMNVMGGTLARLFSGRVYPKIYTDVATKVIASCMEKGGGTSKSLARAEMARGYIDFLQYRLPDVLWQLSSSLGAITVMFFYDWRIGGVCFCVTIPIVYVNNVYKNHVLKYQRNINDTKEELYRVIEENNSSRIHEYYTRMIHPEAKIAKWSSADYGIIKVLLLIIFVVILFICVELDDFTTGKIYSIVAYLWTFITSVEYLPGLMESLISMKDLNRRLGKENPFGESSKMI